MTAADTHAHTTPKNAIKLQHQMYKKHIASSSNFKNFPFFSARMNWIFEKWPWNRVCAHFDFKYWEFHWEKAYEKWVKNPLWNGREYSNHQKKLFDEIPMGFWYIPFAEEVKRQEKFQTIIASKKHSSIHFLQSFSVEVSFQFEFQIQTKQIRMKMQANHGKLLSEFQ